MIPIWLKALIAQAGALLLCLGIVSLGAGFGSVWSILALQGALAAGLSLVFALPWWWLPIQASFLPLLAFVHSAHLPPAVPMGILLALWLMFRSTVRERVPLYLSGQETWHALASLMGGRDSPRFIDLGCGLGGTLGYLARVRQDGEFHGIESAPLPWLVSRVRLLGFSNALVRLGNLWNEDLSRYDVVYAFLSPAPMPALWKKACEEMRPGSIL
ncbi:MAG: methylase, partial [Proteobacteria bacterium]|nr:methylase [Pseudomonadota bacterium]